jgi:serine/threonine-protein kinase
MIDPLSLDLPIAGRYRVIRELGRGGMGAVYVVEHVHTGDHLALKVLLAPVDAAANVARFKQEARISAMIRSENLVKVTDADVAPELEQAPFLVMELLQGSDLERLVASKGALPAVVVVDYLAQVARAIDRAHQLGIIHRDLKPQNLFLHEREDGSHIVKVLDFGISKILDPANVNSSAASMTQTGALVGTPMFMSPEQASGEAAVGPAADVWAIALVAVYLLTGQFYWQSHTLSQLFLDIVSRPMPRPSVRFPGLLPEALDDWFLHACNRDPSRRFGSITELVEGLAISLEVTSPPIRSAASDSGDRLPDPITKGGHVGARTATVANPFSLSVRSAAPRPSRSRRRIAAAVVAAAVAATISVLSHRRVSSPQATENPSSAQGSVSTPPAASASAAPSPQRTSTVSPSSPPPEVLPSEAPGQAPSGLTVVNASPPDRRQRSTEQKKQARPLATTNDAADKPKAYNPRAP